MSKFKKGDKVIRTGSSRLGLVHGGTYTVSSCAGIHLSLVGDTRVFDTYKFELTRPEPIAKTVADNTATKVTVWNPDKSDGAETYKELKSYERDFGSASSVITVSGREQLEAYLEAVYNEADVNLHYYGIVEVLEGSHI